MRFSNILTFSIRTIVLSIITLSSAIALEDASLTSKQILLDKVIAIVDDDIVMKSELEARVRYITNRLRRQGTQIPSQEIMRKRVLEQLIIESIQLQLAGRAGIRIGDAQLNATLQNIAQSNNMNIQQFEQQLVLEGDSFASAREQIRREMILTQVQRSEVDRRVRVTDQEIAHFISSKEGRTQSGTEYNIAHILIAIPETASAVQISVAEQRANEILAELKSGEDFRKTAVAKSDGRQALNGGVIGWRKEAELPSIAADVIPSLAINEPSKLIKTGSGFHIVTVLEKRGGSEKIIEQSNVRHVLISPSEIRTEAEAEEIALKLYERIEGGDDFAQIAKSNSDDPVSAIDGGNLDWVSPGQMVPEFEQVMGQTKVGETSKPFRSQYGWHILQVQDRRQQDMGKLIQKNQAQQIIQRRKFEDELANWLLEIKDEAFIDIKTEKTADDAS